MIRVSPFLGEIPRVASRLIPGDNAARAYQCDLDSGSLRCFQTGKKVAEAPAAAEALFRHPENGEWVFFANPDARAVLSPISNDKWRRLYWTGDGPPKMMPYSDIFSSAPYIPEGYRLGVPEPASSPIAQQPEGEPEEGGQEIDTAYVITYVTDFGEEGPPSKTSNMIKRWDGQEVVIGSIPRPPLGNHRIDAIRIYRAETGGQFLFVMDLPASTTLAIDDIKSEDLGAPLESLDWDEPPPGLTGLTAIGNGVMMGWTGNQLCFSEPYRPHAWPVGYQLSFHSKVVGAAPVPGGVVVVTEHAPWLVSGTTPAMMMQVQMDAHLGGVSEHSVVDMGGYVIYAADDGLVAVSGGSASILTGRLFTRSQWQEYNPSSIKGFRWREKYLAYYEDKQGNKGILMIHPEQGVIHFEAEGMKNAWLDSTSGKLYTLCENGNVHEFAEGTDAPYLWLSKEFTIANRFSLTAAKVDGTQTDQSPVNIRIWGDGEIFFEKTLADSRFFRLPSGRKRVWQFEVTGTAEIYSVQITASPSLLR